MQFPALPKKRRTGRFLLKALPYCFLVAALLSTLVFALGANSAVSDNLTTVVDDSGDFAAQLSAAGIPYSDSDYISEGKGSGVYSLWISPSSNVLITCGDSSWSVTSYGESVGSLLSRQNLEVGEHDLLIAGHASAASPFRITLVHRTVEQFTAQEAITRPVSRVESDALYLTQERVLEEGSDGIRACLYQTVTLNGGYAERTLLEVEILEDPVPQVLECGTMDLPALSPLSITTDFPVSVEENESGGGIITTLSGQKMAYSDTLSVKAYAYTTENKTRKITAIGTTARVGAIAVDPKVIPYGTRMYIQTADGYVIYGVATAEDCGNFRGNEIDLFFNTRDECIQFGKRACTVYFLSDSE